MFGLSIGSFLMEQFLDRELPAFSHLPNSLRALDVNLGVGLFLLALVLATAGLVYYQRVPARLPRELLARRIFSPDDALTCSELGIRTTLAFRFLLRNPASGVRRCLHVVGEAVPDYAKKTRAERKAAKREARANREKNPFRALARALFPDLSDARFYLDSERRDEVERRYVESKNSPKTLAWTAIGSFVLFFVLCRLMPAILQLIDGLIR